MPINANEVVWDAPVGPKIEEVQWDDSPTTSSAVATPTPITFDSALRKASDISMGVGDVAKGMVEGPVASAGGILPFVASVPPAIGKFAVSAVGEIANDPLVLLDSQKRNDALGRSAASAYDTMSGVSEGVAKTLEPTLPNTSQFGQTLTTVAGSLFGAPHEAIDMGAKALYGKEWEEKAKAGKFAFDVIAWGLPHIAGKVKTGEVLRPEDVAEANRVLNEYKIDNPSAKLVKAEDAFDLLRKSAEVGEIPKAVNPVNQSVVDALQSALLTKEGRAKVAYRKAIEKVAEHPEDMAGVDLVTFEGTGKDIKKGPNVVIQEALARRGAIAPKGVGEDVPLEVPVESDAVLNNETKQPTSIVETPPTPPPVEHPLGWLNQAAIEGDLSKGVQISEGWIHNPSTVPFDKSVPATKKRLREAGSPTVNIPKYDSVEAAGRDWEVGGDFTSRVRATEEFLYDVVEDPANPEAYVTKKKSAKSPFSVVQVGDRYYRVVKKPVTPMKPVETIPDQLPEGYADSVLDNLGPDDLETGMGIKEASSEPIFEGTIGPGKVATDTIKGKQSRGEEVTPVDLKAWRDAQVEEINSRTAKAVGKEDLPILDDRFKSYASKEDAIADGATERLMQDPETGRWREEPKFEDDIEGLMSDEVDPYSGGESLLDIIRNERGSIEIDPIAIREGLDRIKRMMEKASAVGKDFGSYLDSIGVGEASKAALLKFQSQVPEYEKRLGEFNKENLSVSSPLQEILEPTSPIVFQKVKKNKQGEVWSTLPAITEMDQSRLLGASQKNVWGSQDIVPGMGGKEVVSHTMGPLDRYLEATETKINAFRRFGADMSHYYRQWRELKTSKEGEFNKVRDEIKGKMGELSSDELKNLGIAAYADMKGGKEALHAMGITEIPLMTPKMMEAFTYLTELAKVIRNRINFIRERTGQRPMPKLLDVNGNENYLPLIRKMNVLREMGSLEALTSMSAAKIKGMNLEFSGIFNPHNLKRNVRNIGIELNPFRAMENYIGYALEEIYTAPLAAKMKEMATAKIPVPGTRGSVTMLKHNPAMAQLMLKWSDEILGIDRTSSIMAIENPAARWAINKLSQNVVTAMIGGYAKTVLKQPTSLIGTFANTNSASMLSGLTRYMMDRPEVWKGKKSLAYEKSNVLSIRRAELAWKDFMDSMSMKSDKSVKDVVARASFVPMEIMDGAIAEISWNAGYRYAEKVLKLGEKERIQYADDMVERTQGMGLRGAVSPIQANIATKWLTLLQTFGIADFNFVAQDVLGIKNPDITSRQQVGRVYRYLIGGVIANQVYQAMGMTAPFPQPVEEFVKSKEDGSSNVTALYKSVMELTEKFPVWGGSAKYGSNLGGVVGQLGTDLPKAVSEISTLLDWDNSTKKQKVNVALGLGKTIFYASGIPFTNQVASSVKAYANGGSAYEVVMGIYVEAKKESSRLEGLSGFEKLGGIDNLSIKGMIDSGDYGPGRVVVSNAKPTKLDVVDKSMQRLIDKLVKKSPDIVKEITVKLNPKGDPNLAGGEFNYTDPKNKTIELLAGSKSAANRTLAHELTHAINASGLTGRDQRIYDAIASGEVNPDDLSIPTHYAKGFGGNVYKKSIGDKAEAAKVLGRSEESLSKLMDSAVSHLPEPQKSEIIKFRTLNDPTELEPYYMTTGNKGITSIEVGNKEVQDIKFPEELSARVKRFGMKLLDLGIDFETVSEVINTLSKD